jgi:hypothetical protein
MIRQGEAFFLTGESARIIDNDYLTTSRFALASLRGLTQWVSCHGSRLASFSIGLHMGNKADSLGWHRHLACAACTAGTAVPPQAGPPSAIRGKTALTLRYERRSSAELSP